VALDQDRGRASKSEFFSFVLALNNPGFDVNPAACLGGGLQQAVSRELPMRAASDIQDAYVHVRDRAPSSALEGQQVIC